MAEVTDVTAAYFKIKNIVDDTEPEELPAVVAAEYGGYDRAVSHLFDLYQQTFVPERAVGESGEFQFTLVTPEGDKIYVLSVADGTCRVEPGAAATEPTCAVRIGMADFLRMSCGQTNGAMLAMTGKLEVEGDVIASMNLADWFVIPETDD
jgi:putative sterol carrier protein